MNVLAALEPVSLSELDAAAALRTRTDAKHVLDAAAFAALLDALAPTHRALELGGERRFRYDTVYFDTPGRDLVRAHLQGRRTRWKARTRRYVDSGTCVVELKRRDGRGATVKTRAPHDAHGELTSAAEAFLREQLGDLPPLAPVLRTTYRRITLLGPDGRLTADLDLRLGDAVVRPGLVVVESKSVGGHAHADRVLRELGSRPVSLSKYVLGVGLTERDRPPHALRPVARRLFAWTPSA